MAVSRSISAEFRNSDGGEKTGRGSPNYLTKFRIFKIVGTWETTALKLDERSPSERDSSSTTMQDGWLQKSNLYYQCALHPLLA